MGTKSRFSSLLNGNLAIHNANNGDSSLNTLAEYLFNGELSINLARRYSSNYGILFRATVKRLDTVFRSPPPVRSCFNSEGILMWRTIFCRGGQIPNLVMMSEKPSKIRKSTSTISLSIHSQSAMA